MPKVIADITMSLDGYVTGPGADEQHGLGDAPELRTWVTEQDAVDTVEFVAPVDGAGGFGAALAKHGPGQIGPLVWEVADIDAARTWVLERGFRIKFEYDSSQGNASERSIGVYQLILEPE